jgi:hypothetical protein
MKWVKDVARDREEHSAMSWWANIVPASIAILELHTGKKILDISSKKKYIKNSVND